jgi:hypothetical protein
VLSSCVYLVASSQAGLNYLNISLSAESEIKLTDN